LTLDIGTGIGPWIWTVSPDHELYTNGRSYSILSAEEIWHMLLGEGDDGSQSNAPSISISG